MHTLSRALKRMHATPKQRYQDVVLQQLCCVQARTVLTCLVQSYCAVCWKQQGTIQPIQLTHLLAQPCLVLAAAEKRGKCNKKCGNVDAQQTRLDLKS